ncbi:MAG: hypothetical protein CM15mP111_4570 [Hyphomicrobiales bacterium]|nr:MAG: hypothetical protein CM15mP111_4570 [Hyphomicrobiales bacterium]
MGETYIKMLNSFLPWEVMVKWQVLHRSLGYTNLWDKFWVPLGMNELSFDNLDKKLKNLKKRINPLKMS